MIVREYLTGRLGYSALTKKYGVKSTGQLRAWVLAYKKYGVEGIMRKKINEVYSVQFKLDVLSFMKRAGASRTETALHFGLTNPPLISSWKKKFLQGGAGALDNAPMENFFGLLKQEMYYGEPSCTYEELKRAIEAYIQYYNNKRIKKKLDGMSPVQYRLHTSQLAA